jgi:hypothetical protein
MNIVKVKFYNEETKEFKGREYSYYSEDPLKVGDIVTAPTFRGQGKVQVTAVDVQESEIVAFKDAVKTIPAVKKEVQTLSQAAELAEPGIIHESIVEFEPIVITRAIPADTAIISVNPVANLDYLKLKDSLISLKQYAEARFINSDKDIVPATDDLAVISKCKKELTALRDQYIKPIRGYLEEVAQPFSELAGLLADAELINKEKIKAFTIFQQQKMAEIAEVNRQAEEVARKQAALNGGEFTVNTTPIEAPTPVHKVSTQSGATTIVKQPPTWELENETLVPKEYWMLDTTKIGKVIRAGGSIPGIKIIQQTGVRVTTRSY